MSPLDTNAKGEAKPLYHGPIGEFDFSLPRGTNKLTVVISDPLSDKANPVVITVEVEDVPISSLDLSNLSPAAVGALVDLISSQPNNDALLLEASGSPDSVQLSSSKTDTSPLLTDPFGSSEGGALDSMFIFICLYISQPTMTSTIR